MIKLSIIIKGDSHKMTVNHLLYDNLELSQDNFALSQLVSEAFNQFPLKEGDESPSIKIKTVLDWQP